MAFCSRAWAAVVCLVVSLHRVQSVHLLRGDHNVSKVRLRVATLLSTKAKLFDSVEFTKLVREADVAKDTPEGLAKVKGLIRDMINRKTADLHDSTTEKEFCAHEMPKAKSQLEKINNEIEQHAADHDKLEAEIAELKDDTADLHKDVVRLHKNTTEEHVNRHDEEEKYDSEKGRYEGVSKPLTEPQIEARIKAEQKEAEKKFHFQRLMEKNEEGLALKEQSIKHKQAQLLKMEKELSEVDQDARFQKELLSSAKSYKEQVERRCLVPKESHAERQARRNAQMETLKDAYAILNGDGIPPLS